MKLENFAEEKEMQINSQKTKIMLFNSRKKFDFQPEIADKNGDKFEVVEEFKLLGVHMTSDFRWNAHTKNICTKSYSKLWMLRNLKKFGAKTGDLVDIYQKQCIFFLDTLAKNSNFVPFCEISSGRHESA